MTFYYKGYEEKIPEVKCWYPKAIVYDAIKAGSIDGTDIEPHDAGITRALNSNYKISYKAKGNPLNTIFVGRLSLDTTEKDLENEFCRYGKMIALRLVKDLITGLSKRYAFIEYETFKMALNTYVLCKKLVLKNSQVFVDFECGRLLPGWKPRRLGGGFGGEKQSGQLRFGGRVRCFRPPLNLDVFKRNRSNNKKDKEIRKSITTQSTRNIHSNSVSNSTTSAPSIISLPLTPPSQPAIVLPLTPPSYSNALLPLTPPSQSIIVLPLTPPSNSTVTLPLTPPSHSTTCLPLTPPPNSIPPS
ncbi:U11/U12 small nuclear ribonucleoprotein 35 kDa protein [Acyrthosiphon pisum]|uniref:U11/U12 small nuclear ribonucleoprotein 35 kDa protein n=1 Tax=Acyrthosiphon pisum TaxID=7029 RepID=A0A8R1W3Y5_ACYPI|nr:U11/U12 small nuclear ribonucleoprotein 35 kDa protein [Acyrthosiphon pisum]|eukprot:XP_001951817.1 PREDICTED: U11/U12 small nuclear ribonucleoprotein 35 kDa protein [Acyrthosiphon pisum]